MKLACRLFGHSGDWRHAMAIRLFWRSTCRRCGAPVVKDALGGAWEAARPEM